MYKIETRKLEIFDIHSWTAEGKNYFLNYIKVYHTCYEWIKYENSMSMSIEIIKDRSF